MTFLCETHHPNHTTPPILEGPVQLGTTERMTAGKSRRMPIYPVLIRPNTVMLRPLTYPCDQVQLINHEKESSPACNAALETADPLRILRSVVNQICSSEITLSKTHVAPSEVRTIWLNNKREYKWDSLVAMPGNSMTKQKMRMSLSREYNLQVAKETYRQYCSTCSLLAQSRQSGSTLPQPWSLACTYPDRGGHETVSRCESRSDPSVVYELGND